MGCCNLIAGKPLIWDYAFVKNLSHCFYCFIFFDLCGFESLEWDPSLMQGAPLGKGKAGSHSVEQCTGWQPAV